MTSTRPISRRGAASGSTSIPHLIFGDLWEYDPAPESADPRLRKRYGLFIGGKFVSPRSGKYFDSINPAAPIRQYTLLERAEVFWDAQENPGLLGKIGRMLARTREGIATHFRVKLEVRAASSNGITEPHSHLRMLKVRETHWESMKAYQPAPLGCHITLFKSRATEDKFDIPDDYGWRLLVDSIEIVNVEGKHLTMFAPQHVASLAREISKRLPAG